MNAPRWALISRINCMPFTSSPEHGVKVLFTECICAGFRVFIHLQPELQDPRCPRQKALVDKLPRVAPLQAPEAVQ